MRQTFQRNVYFFPVASVSWILAVNLLHWKSFHPAAPNECDTFIQASFSLIDYFDTAKITNHKLCFLRIGTTKYRLVASYKFTCNYRIRVHAGRRNENNLPTVFQLGWMINKVKLLDVGRFGSQVYLDVIFFLLSHWINACWPELFFWLATGINHLQPSQGPWEVISSCWY